MNAITLPPVPARTLRNAQLSDLIPLLQQQHRQKVDVVVPLSQLRLNGGALEVAGLEPVITDDGVTEISGLYRPTVKVDSDLAGLFNIPLRYVRRMRDEHVELLDSNVNAWAARGSGKVLLRLFYGSDERNPESTGIARAVLSDRYGFRDNLDTILAALDGMRAAGLAADNISSVSLSDDKLYMFVEAPEVSVLAPKLLEGYRSPFNNDGPNQPIVHAGFVIQNSETGQGACSVTPRLVVRICSNGLTMNKDAMRKVHLGGRMAEGQVAWKQDTMRAVDEAIRLQMRDAVTTFLTEDYVAGAVASLEKDSDTAVSDPSKTMEVVAKELSFTKDEASLIFSHFIKGGQITAGGYMQAVTSAAQEVEDIDRANEIESLGVNAMLAAVKANR